MCTPAVVFDEEAICSARSGRGGSGVPKHIVVKASIGAGANNEVVAVTCTRTGLECVLRRPLKNTDSRHKDDAMREARYTIAASDADAGPRLIDIWYVRKTVEAQRRGLYMISERYDCDMASLLEKDPRFFAKHAPQLRQELVASISKLAKRGIFSYDMKPPNAVCSLSPLRVRLIDLGADYTVSLDDEPASSLVKHMYASASEILGAECDAASVREAICFSFFMAMLVCYAAHSHEQIHGSDLGIDSAMIFRCNLPVAVIADVQRSAPDSHSALAWSLLSHKALRKTFEHYFDMNRQESHVRVARRTHFRPPKN
tara:strand:+ start:2019 stop:2963 length:945 start_codon:yes stop_codon:yes gene_type:complete